MRDQLTVIPRLEKKLEEQDKLLSSASDNIVTLSRALRDIHKTLKNEVEDFATSLVLVVGTFICVIEKISEEQAHP